MLEKRTLPPLNAAHGSLVDTGHSMGAAACFCPASSCSHISGNAFEVWSPFLSLSRAWLDCSVPTPYWWDKPGWSPTQASCCSGASCSCPQRPLPADLRPIPCTALVPLKERPPVLPAPTAADPQNSGNKEVRNQINWAPWSPSHLGHSPPL